MLWELQKIPYSTKGMDNLDTRLEWDSKNINPLRDILHKAEKELGKITNDYEGLLTEEQKLHYQKDLELETQKLKEHEQKGIEDINTQLIRNHISYYEERLRTGKEGFQLGSNRGFSTLTLKELQELRERVPEKCAFDRAVKKLVELEIEWEKRYNGLRELPDDYEWGEYHLDMFKVDRWLKSITGGIKMFGNYTLCPITLMVYQQNRQPAEFEKLDNEKFVDENGVEMWSWCKDNGLGSIGQTKHCHSYDYYRADDTYLILINQGSTTEHKWKKEDCTADYGGAWGIGGCIQQYQELEEIEQNYKELNEGKSYSCLKGFSKIFMTERAWAVANLMIERKSYIPDKDLAECKTIQEKADECLEQLDDYYLYQYPDRNENNSHYPTSDLKFWITKAYGEERFIQEYEKQKQRHLPECFESEEKSLRHDLRVYFEYRENDIKYAQNWIKYAITSYNNLRRIALEMGKPIKTFVEYQNELKNEAVAKIQAEMRNNLMQIQELNNFKSELVEKEPLIEVRA